MDENQTTPNEEGMNPMAPAGDEGSTETPSEATPEEGAPAEAGDGSEAGM